MEEFLGILFCGGKGKRLEKITEYVSKPLIPVYDKPVFKFGLELLENSRSIKEIIILTNKNNDSILRQTGYRTIIQDDGKVHDMFSGWNYIKKVTGTKKSAVLYPGDNICAANVDELINAFSKNKAEFLFMLKKIKDERKLSQMGSYDKVNGKYYYKKKVSRNHYGVVAPYIISDKFKADKAQHYFEGSKIVNVIYKGIWFDIGDYDSIIDAAKWRQKEVNI